MIGNLPLFHLTPPPRDFVKEHTAAISRLEMLIRAKKQP